ncbi:MAG: NUDIX domain-containing protein [Acidimicrobiia bacterium]
MIATPRSATTICVLRCHEGAMEVLMVRRSETARFMGGTWVFPGGVVDDVDGSDRVAALVPGPDSESVRWIAGGLRELVEEVGIWITSDPFTLRVPPGDTAVYEAAEGRGLTFAGDALTLFAKWTTPPHAAIRFATRFYAVEVPDGLVPDPDASEIDAAEWMRPAEAAAQAASGDLLTPFPTRRTLEQLAAHSTPAAFLTHVGSLPEVPAYEPRVRIDADGALEILIPGDPGFAEIGDEPLDRESLLRAANRSREMGRPIPELGN